MVPIRESAAYDGNQPEAATADVGSAAIADLQAMLVGGRCRQKQTFAILLSYKSQTRDEGVKMLER